jgi:hypothetical protein
MRHQHTLPSAADTDPNGNVGHRVVVLQYYTADGSQPYCDHQPASGTDLAWMRSYVAQGADASHVARWLRHP